MSIFISNLAFGNSPLTGFAKVAVLPASFIATTTGLLLFFTTNKTGEANM